MLEPMTPRGGEALPALADAAAQLPRRHARDPEAPRRRAHATRARFDSTTSTPRCSAWARSRRRSSARSCGTAGDDEGLSERHTRTSRAPNDRGITQDFLPIPLMRAADSYGVTSGAPPCGGTCPAPSRGARSRHPRSPAGRHRSVHPSARGTHRLRASPAPASARVHRPPRKSRARPVRDARARTRGSSPRGTDSATAPREVTTERSVTPVVPVVVETGTLCCGAAREAVSNAMSTPA